MRAGTLRDRVTIQQRDGTLDSYGAETDSWEDVCEVYAAREDLSGREYLTAQQLGGDLTTKFTIRYYPGLTTKMRIQHESGLYDIQAIVDKDGRKRTLEIMARRRDV